MSGTETGLHPEGTFVELPHTADRAIAVEAMSLPGLFVAFASPAFRFLTTPAHPNQDMPDPGRIVPNTEVLLYYGGHPR